MIKMMIGAPRRAGMSHAEFRRYVTEVHGPLVRSVTEVAADIRHYHYNFPVTHARDGLLGHPVIDLDIVTEAWFDSVAAQLRNMEHPRYLQVLRPDEHRFADGARALVHYTRESILIDAPRSPSRVFHLRRRKPGLSRSAFQRDWLAGWTRALRECGGFTCGAGCIQNQTVSEAEHPEGGDQRHFDVIDELFVPDPEAFRIEKENSALLAAIRHLESELTDVTRTRAFVAEVVINIP